MTNSIISRLSFRAEAGPKRGITFVAHMCEAQWGNSMAFLPTCPGDLTDITPGFVDSTGLTFAESKTATEVASLIVLPQQNGVNTAIFGIYPPFTVQMGDRFRAVLACQGDALCNVKYALEYFDANGTYRDTRYTNWQWAHHAGDGPTPVDVDLSLLAGQTVQFTLAVRDADGNPAPDFALWIAPYIYRLP